MQSNISPLTLANHTASESAELDIVAMAKAIGDDLRANILRALARDSFGVMELCKIFAVAQPASRPRQELDKIRENDKSA